MPPEIAALIDKPWLLSAVLAVGAACGMGVERFVASLKRAEQRVRWQGTAGNNPKASPRESFNRPFRAVPLRNSSGREVFDAADQLRIVMEAQFRARPLLNKPERRLLAHLDRALAEETAGWRAMGQVSLGEILESESTDAFSAINSKRVDLLIVDADCRPLHAVEFQGTGHYQGSAAARDAVKKEALRRAGIGYVEVVSGDTPADLRAMVQRLVKRQDA